MTHRESVRKFMETSGRRLPTSPEVPDSKTRKLAANLILEEAMETIKGLGFDVCGNDGMAAVGLEEADKPNLVEILDGACDTRYVLTWTLLVCGMDDAEAQRLVDQSNLNKFHGWTQVELEALVEDGATLYSAPDGLLCVKNKNGKVIKPSNWKKPNLEWELKKQGL